jgi:hypothetical protein
MAPTTTIIKTPIKAESIAYPFAVIAYSITDRSITPPVCTRKLAQAGNCQIGKPTHLPPEGIAARKVD